MRARHTLFSFLISPILENSVVFVSSGSCCVYERPCMLKTVVLKTSV
jgi:hypothetical protein